MMCGRVWFEERREEWSDCAPSGQSGGGDQCGVLDSDAVVCLIPVRCRRMLSWCKKKN